MILLLSNCTLPDIRTDGLYVLLSVTTATLSFFLNFLQLLVILHQNLLFLHKNLVFLHLCLCGQLSSASVLCSLLMGPVPLAPTLHLLTLFTFAPLITILVLQQHPLTGRLGRHHSLGLLLLLAWCQALVISLVPLTSWYGEHPLPPTSFAALVCVLYFLHYPLVLILLVDLCLKRSNKVGLAFDVESLGYPLSAKLWTAKVGCPQKQQPKPDPKSTSLGKRYEPTQDRNQNSQTSGPGRPFRPRNEMLLVFLWSACTLPLVCHTAVMAAVSWDFCAALMANERASLWTSWMTMVFAAVRPVFHAHLEDDLGDGTVSLINTLFRVKQ